MCKKVPLQQLFWSFFRVGALTFGGGYAMLPILEAEVVDRRHWIGDEELLNFYAIAQSTPGVIVVNTATFIGFTEAGYSGAVVATAGVILPSVIIVSLLALCVNGLGDNPLLSKALYGVNIAITALLVSALVRLGKKSVTSFPTALLAISAFLLVQFFGISSIIVIVAAALFGVVFSCRRRK